MLGLRVNNNWTRILDPNDWEGPRVWYTGWRGTMTAEFRELEERLDLSFEPSAEDPFKAVSRSFQKALSKALICALKLKLMNGRQH